MLIHFVILFVYVTRDRINLRSVQMNNWKLLIVIFSPHRYYESDKRKTKQWHDSFWNFNKKKITLLTTSSRSSLAFGIRTSHIDICSYEEFSTEIAIIKIKYVRLRVATI